MKKDEVQQGFDFDSRRQNSGLPRFRKRTKVGGRVRDAHKRTKASDVFFENQINLITVEELAVFFGLAPQTIRNWVAQGKLPYVRIGKRNLFLKRSVQEWINRKEEPQWQ